MYPLARDSRDSSQDEFRVRVDPGGFYPFHGKCIPFGICHIGMDMSIRKEGDDHPFRRDKHRIL